MEEAVRTGKFKSMIVSSNSKKLLTKNELEVFTACSIYRDTNCPAEIETLW